MNILEMFNKFITWPATPENGLVPWYVIGYRALFIPIIYTGLIITVIGITFSHGPYAAKEWCKNQGITL